MKKVCILLAFVFLFGVFSGCAPAEDPRVLSEEFARQIRLDYTEEFGDEFSDPDSVGLRIVWVREDRVALFADWGWEYGQAECSETVREYVFRYPTQQKMTVYQSGNFYSVSEAFAKGVLREEWLKELFQAYQAGDFAELTVEPEVPAQVLDYEISPAEPKVYSWCESPEGALSPEKEAEIRNARGQLWDWSYEDQAMYAMEYFGGFRGTYAVLFSGFPVTDGDLLLEGAQSAVDRAWFSLYRDGTFYTPRQALDLGLLTETEFGILYRNYRCSKAYRWPERYLGDGRVGQRWMEYSGQDTYSLDQFRSYGTWGDSLLVLRGRNTADSAFVQKIGSETFSSDTPFQLYVYNGLTVRTLKDAADSGEISPQDLSILAYFHQKLPEADAYTELDPAFSWETLIAAEKTFRGGTVQLNSKDYYGTYGGYTVFHAFAEGGQTEDLPVGNTVIRSAGDLHVYRDGVTESLSSAYGSGRLTEEQLVKIASLHQARFPTYYREFGQIMPLSDHLAGIMEEAWLAAGSRTRLLPGNCFYGIYDGYAFVLSSTSADNSAPRFYKYGEADLRYGEHFTVYGYQNGKFYTLSELYRIGALSKDTLNALMRLHRQKFSDYYQISAPASPELPDPLRTQVSALAEFPWDGVLYYGNFDGWEVFCRPTESYTVPQYDLFRHSMDLTDKKFELYGYKDGRFLLLTQAEAEGLLTENTAEKIVEYHNLRFFFYVLEHYDHGYGYLP